MAVFNNEVSVTTKPSVNSYLPPSVEQQLKLAAALKDFGGVTRRVQFVESSFKKPQDNKEALDLVIEIGGDLTPANLPPNSGIKVTSKNADEVAAAFAAAAEEGRKLRSQLTKPDEKAIQSTMRATLGEKLNPLLQTKPAASR